MRLLFTIIFLTVAGSLASAQEQGVNCDKQAALIAGLQSKLPNPSDLKIQKMNWTLELGKLPQLAARDRHFFAIADRFGGAHALMNNLDESVEVEYYFRKKNGAMRRGFAMAIVGANCEVTFTYIGVSPYKA